MASVLPGLRCSEPGHWPRMLGQRCRVESGRGRHSGKTEGGLSFLSSPAQPPHPQTPAPKVSFLEYLCGQGAYYTHTPISMHCCPELNSTSLKHCLVLVLSHKRNHNSLPRFPAPSVLPSPWHSLISLSSYRNPGKDLHLFGTKPSRPRGAHYHSRSHALLPDRGLLPGARCGQAVCLWSCSCRTGVGLRPRLNWPPSPWGACPCPGGAGPLRHHTPHPLQTARCLTVC